MRASLAEAPREEAARAIAAAVLPTEADFPFLVMLLAERPNASQNRAGGARYFRIAPQATPRGRIERAAVLEARASMTFEPTLGLRTWAANSLMQVGRIDFPTGAATGDPLGADLVRSRWLPGAEYRVECVDLDGCTCEASIRRHVEPAQPARGPASAAEVWLAEQCVRKMIASYHGLRYQLDLGPPAEWIAVPHRLTLDGRPLTVAPLVERWPWRRAPRTRPVPKPASIGDATYVAIPWLEAMGLTVACGRWASWGLPPEPGSRPLDTVWFDAPERAEPDLVAWLAAPKELVISRGERHLNLLLEQPEAMADDGTRLTLPAPARLLDGYPVVPLAPVAEYFGLNVEVLPGADWSGEEFAAWLDEVSAIEPAPVARTETPPAESDQALSARIQAALTERERLARGLRLGYLADFAFAPDHADRLRKRGKIPPDVGTTWLLHWEWLLPPIGQRADVTPIEPPAAGPLPWSSFYDGREFGILPDGVPGLVQEAWDWERGLLPPPLLTGWGSETWSALFERAERVTLATAEREGRPHHRLSMYFDGRQPGLELWLPADAPASPTALVWQRDLGGTLERQVADFEGYRRAPTGLMVPEAMTVTETVQHAERPPEPPRYTIRYTRITVADAGEAAALRDLDQSLTPLVALD